MILYGSILIDLEDPFGPFEITLATYKSLGGGAGALTLKDVARNGRMDQNFFCLITGLGFYGISGYAEDFVIGICT